MRSNTSTNSNTNPNPNPNPNKPKKKKVGSFIINPAKQLGRGAQAEVYIAHRIEQHEQNDKNEKTKQICAVKILKKANIQKDKKNKDALLYEIEIMRNVKSPNIISFIDVEETHNNIYIFQEYANNGTLGHYMKSKPDRRFEEKEVVECLAQLLNGFIELQRHGIMHRDIKPTNILVKDDKFKIADFGLSRYSGSNNSAKTVSGTPPYMAPQIITSLMEHRPCFYTQKCDIWSLGVLAFELITGQFPWKINHSESYENNLKMIQNQIKNGIEIPPNLPVSDNLKNFIKGCMQYEEDDRFSWNQVFEHPIFKGRFENVALSLENYLITDLRMKIHSQNINLEKFLTKLPDNLSKEEFHSFLMILLPTVTEKQSYNLYKVISQQKNTVSPSTILNFLESRNIKVRGLIGKVLQKEEEEVKKLEKLQKKIAKGVEDNKIDLFQFFKRFGTTDQARIGRQEFDYILTRICPDSNKAQLDLFFDYFNTDKTPSLQFENFYEELCKAAQVPIIKQEKIFNELKKIEERKKN